MQNIFPAGIIAAVIIIAGWLAWGSMNPAAQSSFLHTATTTASTTSINTNESNECTMDAKVCPDGSTVGRTGANCQFAACPVAEATSATIKTTIGQKMTGLNVTITPIEVTDDSRCPTDVQCIWAGTVKVRATIQTPKSTSTETLELNHSIEKDGYTITFTQLTPSPHSGETIPASSYRFVFTVSR